MAGGRFRGLDYCFSECVCHDYDYDDYDDYDNSCGRGDCDDGWSYGGFLYSGGYWSYGWDGL